MEGLLRSAMDAVPDLELRVDEVLACDQRVIAVRQTWRGHTLDGGGEFEIPIGVVGVVEDGMFVSGDQFDYDERRAMIARYAELGGGLSRLGHRAPERHFAEFARTYARGDPEAVAELYAEDWSLTDHRQLGWEELRGRDAIAAAVDTANRNSLDMRLEVDEVIACDERVIAARVAYRGHTIEGGGAYEISVGQVSRLSDDGLWLSADQYDADQREAMLGRYAELAG
jgi:ketosteroid isomerase-like protein